MNKYLNEEQYQKARKKILTIAGIVLVVGLLLAITLMVAGFVKKSNLKDNGASKYAGQISTLQQEISTLEQEISSEFLANGFSNRYYTLEGQRDAKQREKMNLEQKSWDVENSNAHIILFSSAGMVLFITMGASGMLYFIANRRAVAAFTVQQTMPIAQEGLETIAPSVGKVAEEISKGIRKDNSKEQ